MQQLLQLLAITVAVILIQVQDATTKEVFGRPMACGSKGGSSLYNSNYYNRDQSAYTPRDTMDCCFKENTRAKCCLKCVKSASGELTYTCLCEKATICEAPILCFGTTAPPTWQPGTTRRQTWQPTWPPRTTRRFTTRRQTWQPPTQRRTYVPPTQNQPLCPNQSRSTVFRSINGIPVKDQCKYKGIAKITMDIKGKRSVVCQAVYTKSTINQKEYEAFATTKSCNSVILASLNSSEIQISLAYGNTEYRLSNQIDFRFLAGEDGSAYIVPNEVLRDQKPCQEEACAYDSKTMPALESLTDCKFVSFGSTAEEPTFGGLNEVPVKLSRDGCQSQKQTTKLQDSLCFASTSGLNVACTGDLGAPVYCKASTGESIFIGNAVHHECNYDKDIMIVPFKG